MSTPPAATVLVLADPADADRIPPADIDSCEHCDGHGDREQLIDGEPRNVVCGWCDGTGQRGPS